MFHHANDPIIAIATATGRGAVGMIRVSGSDVKPLILALCQRDLLPRVATYLPFRDESGSVIDQGLAIHFPAPNSYTGEDVLELQIHGGVVILQLLLARCFQLATGFSLNQHFQENHYLNNDYKNNQINPNNQKSSIQTACLPSLRLAKPGEFTQRAFLNNKIDLAQAEAIADLIDASTEAAARSAGRSLSGEFSKEIHQLRDKLIHLRMLIEATLDFPEEEIDFLKQADAKGQLDQLQEKLKHVLDRTKQGALLREGIKIVIAGQPNAGKSSLLNALAGAELAIVTPIAGTTRDKVQQTIQIDGVPLHIIDTAGLRSDSTDQVEQIGIERAWEEIKAADAVIFLHDLTRANDFEYQQNDEAIHQTLKEHLSKNNTVLHVWNKLDQGSKLSFLEQKERLEDSENLNLNHQKIDFDQKTTLYLSARTGEGLDKLRRELLRLAGWQSSSEGLYLARARHVDALNRVQMHLQSADQCLAQQAQLLDLLAEELRLSQNALNEITGEFSSDDLLGVIFSSFCIGK